MARCGPEDLFHRERPFLLLNNQIETISVFTMYRNPISNFSLLTFSCYGLNSEESLLESHLIFK